MSDPKLRPTTHPPKHLLTELIHEQYLEHEHDYREQDLLRWISDFGLEEEEYPADLDISEEEWRRAKEMVGFALRLKESITSLQRGDDETWLSYDGPDEVIARVRMCLPPTEEETAEWLSLPTIEEDLTKYNDNRLIRTRDRDWLPHFADEKGEPIPKYAMPEAQVQELELLQKHASYEIKRRFSQRRDVRAGDVLRAILDWQLAPTVLELGPGVVKRALKLIDVAVGIDTGPPAAKFLNRVSRCYMFGFMPEAVVMCRAVMENEVKETFSRRKLTQPATERGRSEMRSMLKALVLYGVLDEEHRKLAWQVWERGSKAAHLDPGQVKDALETIRYTVAVLNKLHEA
jgi:hypothetical protein